MSNGMEPNDDLFTFAKANPTLVITATYVLINLMGVSYAGTLFFGFGLIYFSFAEADDFLAAAFRRPLAIIIIFAILVILSRLVYLYARRHGRDLSTLQYILIATLVAVFTIVVPGHIGIIDRWKIERGTSAIYELTLNRERDPGQGSSAARPEAPRTVSVVGRAGEFLAVHDRDSCEVLVYLRSTVRSLKFVDNKPQEWGWAYMPELLGGPKRERCVPKPAQQQPEEKPAGAPSPPVPPTPP